MKLVSGITQQKKSNSSSCSLQCLRKRFALCVDDGSMSAVSKSGGKIPELNVIVLRYMPWKGTRNLKPTNKHYAYSVRHHTDHGICSVIKRGLNVYKSP